jgi:tRNA threonylcarbamoyladenosine biosynthesis protein TsaE
MMQKQIVFLPDENATLALGAALAAALRPGLKIYLAGELGAGKTTLVRGMLRGLGYPGRVRSPTYTLVELYAISSLYLHHFDFYRFDDPREWSDAGFRDAFSGEAICLVEWPDRAGDLLPPPDIDLRLRERDGGREATLRAATPEGRACLSALAGKDFSSR